MLRIALDGDKTYQNVTKEVFIEKMDEVFSKFIAEGDTFLRSHKGICNFENCCNKGCLGYSFVGNNSKKHIDFIFEEDENDMQEMVLCEGFQIEDKSIEVGSTISMNIKKDEEANFKQSIDFLIFVQKCDAAYDELVQLQNSIIDKDVILGWLEKHHSLYDFFNNYASLAKFNELYALINNLGDCLKYREVAIEAVEAYNTLDENNEAELLKWLVKYEDTGTDVIFTLIFKDAFGRHEDMAYFEYADFKINRSDFVYIFRFNDLFEAHYWKMLEKYEKLIKIVPKETSNKYRELSGVSDNLAKLLKQGGLI